MPSPVTSTIPSSLRVCWGRLRCWSSLLGLALILTIPACAERQPRVPASECNAAAPSATPPPAPTPPLSTIHTRLRIRLSSIEAAMAKAIPKRLAREEDRPIGAPGRATYRVDRGNPRLRASGGKLRVTVPVRAAISVCKPVGSFCLGYGKCNPAWDLTYSVSTNLGSDFALASPKLEVKTTRRCVIGIDVTEQLTSIVKREGHQVRRRLVRELPDLREQLTSSWPELAQPAKLGGTCVHVVPEQLSYGSPFVENDHLIIDARGQGQLWPAPECESTAAPPLVLPERVSSWPDSPALLWVPEQLSAETLGARMTERLAKTDLGEMAVEAVEVAPDRELLLFQVSLRSSRCAGIWLRASPALQPDGRLGFESVAVVAESRGALRPKQEAALVSGVESTRLDTQLAELVQTGPLGRSVKEVEELMPPETRIDSVVVGDRKVWPDAAEPLQPAKLRVKVTPGGLWLLLGMPGRTEVTLR